MSEPPRLGGRFRLVRLAGKGGSGEVYLAIDEATGRTVAVKWALDRRAAATHPEPADPSEERFVRERRLLEVISSPHVVRLVGHGVSDDGRSFIAVDWLDGTDLARRQKERPLDGRGVVDVVRQIAAGLEAIHRVGSIHRDVKPANIFVSDATDGGLRATVIDLGIARREGEPALTHRGHIVGTPWYMSPEQILESPRIGPASDQFSLGVVAFELIAGVRPYRGDDVLAVVAKIALTDPPRLSDVVDDVPSDVDAIVARAMSKDPEARFPTPGAFAEALANATPFRTSVPSLVGEPDTEIVSSRGSMAIAALERRVVTVVFARFRDPEEARVGQAAFEATVRRRGGVPHALLSIALAAVFGAERSTGDEPVRAASAAMDVLRELPHAEVVVTTARSEGGLPVDAIERAARRRSSEGGTRRVRIDAATARLLGDAFEIQRVGTELEIFGERRPHGSPRMFLGLTSKCVGRDREVAELEALYAEVTRESVARVAIVTASAGMGKSRLRQELLSRLGARDDAPVVLLGHGNAITDGATFGLMGSALRGAAGLREDDPPEARRQKIARLVGPAPNERLERALLHVVSGSAGVADTASRAGGVAPAEGVTVVARGELTPDRVRAAFDAWLRDFTSRRPVAIVLEDVHWADPPSVALVDSALRNLADRPLFVLAFARPEVNARFPRLFDARDPRRIALPKLTRRASEALVRSGVGEAIGAPLIERILERADGNAFYLEELVRSVASRLETAADTLLELPDTVLGTVQARLDALGDEAKRIIKAASIFGDAASSQGIADVLAGFDLEGVERALAALVHDEVLETSTSGGETTYVFRHALLRDGAYELLADEQRRAGHARAAASLLGRGERDALVVARHLDLAGALADAAPHYGRAATHALQAGDFAQAVACADKALRGGTSGDAAGALLVLTAEAHRWLGDFASVLEPATRAVALLAPGSRGWFAAMRELIDAHGRLGRLTALEPLVERVMEARPDDDAIGAKITALTLAATNFLYNGDTARGAGIVPKVDELARASMASLSAAEHARVHELHATHAALTDQLEIARDAYLKALTWLDPAGEERRAVIVRSNLAFVELQLGDVERSEQTLREALPVAVRLGVETTRALLLQNLGIALRLSGRADEALEAQTRALDLFVAHKDRRLAGWSRVHLAVLALDRSDLAVAFDLASAALAEDVDVLAIAAHAIVATVHLRRGDVEPAIAAAEAGVAAIERVGCVEDFDIFAFNALAEGLLARGDRARARDVLRVARQRIERRLEGISDPLLRASFITRVPDNALAYARLRDVGD